ncbi:DUF397 domain-containing protein [Actinomadura rugatobispora]|uniref:DUF397 domain-containing protein n=1 Tax=Actinomadura rugatobispora TaxID=1994 RepID=A0ABW0ZS26_9ACTN|nr:hypothetical protein GCM10010200_076320 [Actinomadura rugatobispora]
MNASPLSQVTWRKSSHSQLQASECVEVAAMTEAVAVRDSKDPHGPVLTLPPTTWHSLLRNLKNA